MDIEGDHLLCTRLSSYNGPEEKTNGTIGETIEQKKKRLGMGVRALLTPLGRVTMEWDS